MDSPLVKRYMMTTARWCRRRLPQCLVALVCSGCLMLLLLSSSPPYRQALQQPARPDMAALLRRTTGRLRSLPSTAPRQRLAAASASLRNLTLAQVMISLHGSTDMELVRRGQMKRPTVCPQRAIVPWAGGRIGNLVFEYLPAWSLARLHNATLLVPDTMIETFEGVFTGMTAQRGDLDFLMMDCAHLWQERRQLSLAEIEDVWEDLAPINGWVELLGFPVNMTRSLYQLWHAYGKEMHSELQFSAPISQVIQEYMWRVRRALSPQGEEVTFVGVHARRTDYYDAQFNLQGVWMTVPDELYFSRGLRHYQSRYSNVVFLVVSDDMAWCRQHLGLLDGVVLFPGGEDNPAMLDMALLSHCNHTLITYGTFALSGALMSGGDVVVAGDTGAKFDFYDREKEVWPADWTELSVK